MRYKIDHDYHLHSQVSLCSNDPEQSNERILQYARENGLKKIILTDHFWDAKVDVERIPFYVDQHYEHLKKALPLPKCDEVEFLFGCETDLDKHFNLGVAPENFEKFAFIVIPTTHLHMTDFTYDVKDSSVENRARLWIERFEAVLNMDLPFRKVGIAHLACGLIAPKREEVLAVLELLPEEKLFELFTKAAKLGAGIELNCYDMKFTDAEADVVLRIFKIAKKCGCKFYLSTDAHHPQDFEGVVPIFERAIDLLELTEDDKFHINNL